MARTATISDGQGLGTISIDDAAPTLRITDVTANEGSLGPTFFTFTVSLTGSTALVTTVDFATANGTTNPATSGAAYTGSTDYITQTSTPSFPAGTTSQTVIVQVCGDTTFEANETFFVNLSSAMNATFIDGQEWGPIPNDVFFFLMMRHPPTPTLFPSPPPFLFFTVSLPGSTALVTTVDFATANGTTNPATGGAACTGSTDYISQTGTLTFPAGTTSQTVIVQVCGDTTFEANETDRKNVV